ncbi:hypothetical protein [Thioclava indica]|uniref:Uncharacterized protein n=1 Tax=Thioclava indica TaxID=1353528 RepID=A0A074KGG8_9RHOB|nr:hypothetical protein [Thioclava indica]KEO60612.1 hypothetical protein DT23_12900 [Thioclava indica]
MSRRTLKRFRQITPPLFASLVLAGCTEANHIGNPLTLPIRAIASGAENAAYSHKRGVVKTWITRNEAGMRAERFDGPVTQSLLETLPAAARNQARQDLKEAAPHADFPERATVIIMVHRD